VIALRIAVVVLTAFQTAITAYVAFPGATADAGQKAILIAVSMGLAILVNQLPRVQDKPDAPRSKPVPHG
jgi:hypothetical protein